MAITADPVDPARINNFEFWLSEEDLNSFRAIANPPKAITPIVKVEIQSMKSINRDRHSNRATAFAFEIENLKTPPEDFSTSEATNHTSTSGRLTSTAMSALSNDGLTLQLKPC
nr:hypothetical protein [Bradyrhizobium sp. AS23.2]